MSLIDIRRIVTHVEDIHHEGGPRTAAPLRRGAIAAVLANPYAGRFEPDILPMMDALQPVGIELAQRLRAAMDVPAAVVSISAVPVPSAACQKRLNGPFRREANTIRFPSGVHTG